MGKVLYDLFHEYEGRRIITTCFASHIHRVQQIADAAIAFGRTIATWACRCGRTCASRGRWACCTSPNAKLRDIEDVDDLDPGERVRHQHRLAGRADVGAGALAADENRWLQGRRRTTS